MAFAVFTMEKVSTVMKFICFILKVMIIYVLALSLGILSNPIDRNQSELDAGTTQVGTQSIATIEGIEDFDVVSSELIEQLAYILERRLAYNEMLEEAQSLLH